MPFVEIGLLINNSLHRDVNTKSRIGFGGHVYFNLANSQRFEFQLGSAFRLIKFHKGKISTSQLQSLQDVDFSIKYLSFPINLNVFLDKRQKFQFRTGIFADLLMGAKYSGLKTSFTPSQGWTQFHVTESPNLKPFTAGITLGLYAQIFEKNRIKIRLGANWYYRPLNVSNEQFSIKTSTLSFGLSSFF